MLKKLWSKSQASNSCRLLRKCYKRSIQSLPQNETLRHCLLIQKTSGCGNYFKGLSQWNLFLAALEDTFRLHTEKIIFLSLMAGIQIVQSVVFCACMVVPKSLDFASKSVNKEMQLIIVHADWILLFFCVMRVSFYFFKHNSNHVQATHIQNNKLS